MRVAKLQETAWRSGCPKRSSNRFGIEGWRRTERVAASKREIVVEKRDRRAEFLKAMDRFR